MIPSRLPLEALSLAMRFFLPLAFFYTAGRVVHDLVLVAAAYAGDVTEPRKYVGFAIMSLAVLATLAAYVAMLQVLGRGRPNLQQEGEGGDDRLATAIAQTLLPFLAFYGAWGLFADDVRQYSILSQELFGVQEIENLSFNPLLVTGLISAGVFALRVVAFKGYERWSKRWLRLVVTVFEAMWMFFAVISLEWFISERIDWLTSRDAWVGAAEVIGPVLGPVADGVGFVLPNLKDALLMPLVWLTIAAVVYGRVTDSDADVIAGTRAEPRAGRAWSALPGPVRTTAEFVSRDLRGKYMPMLNGLRLVLRAGPIFFLVYCLCFVVLELARDWAFIGLTQLIGPQEANWWTLWHGPVKFVVTALYEVLRISLLAAAFHLVASAVRDRERPPAEPQPAAN